MKAAVLKMPGKLIVEDVPSPTCKESDLIVKVKACGICGSDLRYFNGDNPWALHTLGMIIENPPNIILGHEFSGEIIDTGDKNDNEMVGKRVAVLAFNTCGICELCKTGRYHLCKKTLHIGHGAGWGKMDYYPGGMAEFCSVWRTHVCEIPDNISFDEATILDPLSVAIHAISRSGIKPGDEVLVLGSGPVGLCIAQASRAFGSYRVYASDIYRKALDIAHEVGVNEAIDSNKVDIHKYIMQKTNGQGVNIVFDTVGTAETQKLGLKTLAVSGTLVNLVANNQEATYCLMDLSGERRIVSTANNLKEDFLLGIKLLSDGTVNANAMITHKFPLKDVNEAFDILFNKEKHNAMKVIISL